MKNSHPLENITEIKKEVDNAFDKVFSGNTRENKGSTDNHCNGETLDYFAKLYEGEDIALQRREEILKEIEADCGDVSE
ncbi:hypothetical protein [Helicobacter sp. UBA3407]|uniref:hypothetical protein n=1 Tax=Helicobacter TaxID=209 RepID=UPI00261C7E3E|nr:hypothetical protein [Helicobacter sp. UBA3407]